MPESQNDIRLSIVIPCYNEAGRLPKTLRKSTDYLAQQPYRSEILVVSDGSKDNTAQSAGKFFEQLPPNVEARVIEYQPNAGKGKAVKMGMLAAKGSRILFMDADYSVPLEDLSTAERLLDDGIDIAIGSRAVHDTQILEHQSFLRERFAKLFGLIQRTYLGLKLQDTQCGFKLFTREAAQAIFPHVKITSVIFDGEMLWLAKKLGLKVREFPVEWTHDQDTRITYTPFRALLVLRDMINIPLIHVNRRKMKK